MRQLLTCGEAPRMVKHIRFGRRITLHLKFLSPDCRNTFHPGYLLSIIRLLHRQKLQNL